MDRHHPAWYQPPLGEVDHVFIDARVWIDNTSGQMQLSWKVTHPVTEELLGMYVQAPEPLKDPGALSTSLVRLLLPLLNDAVNPF